MRETHLTIPEIGLIAATRGILGAGIGFLLADQVPQGARRILGWTLFSLGTLSTIPLALTVFGRRQCEERAEMSSRVVHSPSARQTNIFKTRCWPPECDATRFVARAKCKALSASGGQQTVFDSVDKRQTVRSTGPASD